MNKTQSLKGLSLSIAAIIAITSTPASAVVSFDADVTPDIIFGSGNSNGAFTVDRDNGLELGLRAKIPFIGTTNSNGDGTYSFSLAETAGAGNPPGSLNAWNFDWTINTDYNDTSGDVISDYTYLLGIDFDPGLGTDFFTFDPVTPGVAPLFAPFYDHSIGDNSTGNGLGVEAGDAVTYQGLIDNNNVLQQSWRHAFFAALAGKAYDPTVSGTYDVFLTALDVSGAQVAHTEIRVTVGDIPEPAPFALLGLSLVVMGLYRRKKG